MASAQRGAAPVRTSTFLASSFCASYVTETKHLPSRSSQAFKQGGRRGAKKVMIVITDGESHDSPDLQQAIEDSEKDGITRYAIAVSLLLRLFAWFIRHAPFSWLRSLVIPFKSLSKSKAIIVWKYS